VANFITFRFLDKCRYYDIGSNFIKLQTDMNCQLQEDRYNYINMPCDPGTYSYFTSQVKYNTSNQSAYEHLFRSFIIVELVNGG
jgi:hypothetical protein